MPSSPERSILTGSRVCQWVNRRQALHHFATYTGPTQSQQHIKPLHWYVACRLVLEGGSQPDNITPRPPFTVVTRRGESILQFTPNLATGSERTILGGLKTKNVDEERYLYGAPDLKAITQRLTWSPASPVFSRAESEASGFPALDYAPRLATREG